MESSQTPAEPLRLTIRGLGPLFNFKNSKMMTGGKLITDPDLKKRMQAIVQSLELQLRCALRTSGAGTSTDARQQFLTRSLPQDDCWTCIPELILTGELSDQADEGADITIERLE